MYLKPKTAVLGSLPLYSNNINEAFYHNIISDALYHQHSLDHVHTHQGNSENTMHVSITLLITTNDQNQCHSCGNKNIYQQLIIMLHISTPEVAGWCLSNCPSQQGLFLQIFHSKDAPIKTVKANFNYCHTNLTEYKD